MWFHCFVIHPTHDMNKIKPSTVFESHPLSTMRMIQTLFLDEVLTFIYISKYGAHGSWDPKLLLVIGEV